MKPKVLFVANIAKHIVRFHLPYLKWFQEKGYETHVATNGDDKINYCDFFHYLPIDRSPYSLANIKAISLLRDIVKNSDYDLIHCHTPMGSVVARIAAIGSRNSGTKVLYTSHGFHFYKGAPVTSWLFYYPVEKILSKYTDGIITINKEDYDLLYTKNFQSKGKFIIKGVGVDSTRFQPKSLEEKKLIRKKLGFTEKDFILVYAAEFIARKNHSFIINASTELAKVIPNLKVLFAGRGDLKDEIDRSIVRSNLSDVVSIIGFRENIEEFMAVSDIGISASRQEGLGLNLAEEMFMGLPIVASDIRGHRDLVMHNENGYLYQLDDISEFTDYVITLYKDEIKRCEYGKKGLAIANDFSLDSSLSSMAEIYGHYIYEPIH
jgi:glycosyltransferase EpsD